MPTRRSAGVLLWRRVGGEPAAEGAAAVEVLLGHMGGPFWALKDESAWSLPKGEHGPEEEPQAAARREFAEELGLPAPDGEWVDLGEVRQSAGKVVHAWAVEGDLDPAAVTPGHLRDGVAARVRAASRRFPELDRVEWTSLDDARTRLVTAQRSFLDRLELLIHLNP